MSEIETVYVDRYKWCAYLLILALFAIYYMASNLMLSRWDLLAVQHEIIHLRKWLATKFPDAEAVVRPAPKADDKPL